MERIDCREQGCLEKGLLIWLPCLPLPPCCFFSRLLTLWCWEQSDRKQEVSSWTLCERRPVWPLPLRPAVPTPDPSYSPTRTSDGALTDGPVGVLCAQGFDPSGTGLGLWSAGPSPAPVCISPRAGGWQSRPLSWQHKMVSQDWGAICRRLPHSPTPSALWIGTR